MDEINVLHVKKWDQWLLNALMVTPKDRRATRVRYRVLSAVRQARLWFSDPLVHFPLGESMLLLPLSHELPLYRRNLPDYAMNLGRVVAIVQAKYRNLTMIDIGANIGDSFAVVRAVSDVPILCVEGEDRFFQLLEINTRGLADIELEHAFVGDDGDPVGAIHVARGTAYIELGAPTGPDRLVTHSLRELIVQHPRFAGPKFLKLDAEGFDCKIISCECRFLAKNKPVLFFEYHPPFCEIAGYDPFPVFMRLADIGYSVVTIYENTGRYMLSVELSQRSVLEDIHGYFVKIGGFCDVIAYHAEDRDIAEAVRESELENGANWSTQSHLVNKRK